MMTMDSENAVILWTTWMSKIWQRDQMGMSQPPYEKTGPFEIIRITTP